MPRPFPFCWHNCSLTLEWSQQEMAVARFQFPVHELFSLAVFTLLPSKCW